MQIDLKVYSSFALSTSRRAAAQNLARELGASDLIIFDRDEEVGRFLPSIGFPQTLPEGRRWAQFLLTCSKNEVREAQLPFPPTNQVVKVICKKLNDDSLWAFSAGDLSDIKVDENLELLALNLCKVLKSERENKKHEGQNQTLRELTNDLRTYADALNHAKSDLNRALKDAEKAKTAAEKANATKSAFLANMSHEIRTPLGAILGFSALLKEPGLSPEDREQYIETMNRNGQALTRIIDDILDLAKVEAGKLEVEEIDFSLFDLMSEVIDLFRDKVKQKNIYLLLNIDDSVPNHICSDPTRLRQIVINIVGNAVKFTDHGGVKVNVRAQLDPEGALKIQIEIRDTGPGLTEEQRERLFQPFMQADNSTTREFGGTGLGLSLSKRLSEALGGTITIDECAPEKGCTFVISLVATIPPESKFSSGPERERVIAYEKILPLKNIKVLLVDDSVDNQFLVKRFLSKNGAIVGVASDGSEAVNKALANSYDIVLMDIQMPKMDGYEALKTLLEKGFKIPVIALTAHAMLEDRAKTQDAGFAAHLVKPLNFPELIQIVNRFAPSNMDKK